jgi:hypothetical protein
MPVKHLALALLLAVPGMAQAARCGKASAPAGAGTLELSLWQDRDAAPSEHAVLTVPSRDDRFVMTLSYKPAAGQVGAPTYVQLYAYGPPRQQVRHGDVLTLGAGRAAWQGPPRGLGLSSSSGRPWGAGEYLIAGDEARPDPALIRAFAAGGKVKVARAPRDGSRIKSALDLPSPRALSAAYRDAKTKAGAALIACGPPSVKPAIAP